MHKIVYLACELKSRDLNARMLVAAHLLKAGCAVAIGQKWTMTANAAHAPVGLYLFGTLNKHQARVMTECRGFGHAIVAMDEESLPFVDEGFLVNIDPDAIPPTDLFLALSDNQRRVLRDRFPNLKVRLTGNARIDLLVNLKTARPIPEPYVLFNTNFALTNSIWGNTEEALQMLVSGGGIDPATEAGRAELQTRIDYEVDSKAQLMPLIRWCADQLPVLTVVRPHPAENASAWSSILPGHPRFRAAQGSAPAPWLAHAKLVVHANSTTGLEAAILGTPCLNVSPAKYDNWVKYSAMRRVNHTVADAQTAADAIAQFMKAGKGLEPRTTALGLKGDAAARIADACLEVLRERAATPCDVAAMSWTPAERGAKQIQKFSVTTDEFAAAFQDASQNLRLPPTELIALDDSAVLLRPRAAP